MIKESGRYINDFIEYITFQKRYSDHTSISYTNDLNGFFNYIELRFSNNVLSDIDVSIVRSWLTFLKESGMEPKSLNRKMSCLRSFFNFHIKNDTVKSNPLSQMASIKFKKRLPQFIQETDINTLFTHIEFPDTWEGKTHKLILDLLYNTGMRQAELLSLKHEHIDFSNRYIKILGKGNKERLVPVSDILLGSISRYIQSKNSDLISPNVIFLLVGKKGRPVYAKYLYLVVNAYLSAVTTVDKKSPHIMRHTFATHLMNHGAELVAIKELLGHNTLAATQVYLHNSVGRLKEVHSKAHPKP